jgi:hypothetical protein
MLHVQLEEFHKHVIHSTAAQQHNSSFRPGLRNFAQKYTIFMAKNKRTTAGHWEKRAVVYTFLSFFQIF